MQANYLFKQLKQFSLGTLTMSALLGASYSFAGDRVGNGGDVVICEKNSRESIELLDYFESKKEGRKIHLGKKKLSLREKVGLGLSYLRSIDPARYVIYEKEALKMLKDIENKDVEGYTPEAVSFTDEDLRELDDSAHISIPKNCKVKQLIIQYIPPFEEVEKTKYVFQEDIWNKMSKDQQAASVLHEIIYKEFFKDTDSRRVRYFNSFIYSGEVQKMRSCAYMDFLKKIKVKTYLKNGVVSYSTMDDKTCFDNGELKEAKLAGNSQLVNGITINVEDVVLSESGEVAYAKLVSEGYYRHYKKRLMFSGEVGETIKFDIDVLSKKFTYASIRTKNGQIYLNDVKNSVSQKDKIEHYVLNYSGLILNKVLTSRISRLLTETEKEQVNTLMTCAKDVIQSRVGGVDALLAIDKTLYASRSLLEEEKSLEGLIADCEDLKNSPEKRISKSKQRRFYKNNVNMFKNPSVIKGILMPNRNFYHCESSRTGVALGALVGIDISSKKLNCVLGDGEQATFQFPQIKLSLNAWGGSVYTTKSKNDTGFSYLSSTRGLEVNFNGKKTTYEYGAGGGDFESEGTVTFGGGFHVSMVTIPALAVRIKVSKKDTLNWSYATEGLLFGVYRPEK